MKIFSGRSFSPEAHVAVAEATREVPAGEAPDLVLAFCSSKQSANEIATALRERFPRSIVTGCTTSGEHIGDEHLRGSLVVAALFTPDVRWSLEEVDLPTVDEASARATVDRLIRGLGISREDLDPKRHFCLTFIDGLSLKEELAASLVAEALEGVPLLGGSAGDDLLFRETRVFVGGEAKTGVAAFLLAESKAGFTVVKHQHFTTTAKSLVITRADVPNRRVYEMDGFPALEGYANALGVSPGEITSELTFLHPLTFVCNGEVYVRSIQQIEPDGSLVFYCAIEEGMVLYVGGHEPMDQSLERDIAVLKKTYGEIDLFIACNCILRALEAEKSSQHAVLGKIIKSMSRNVIGFDTYGEQLHGLHINQTLVGVALHGSLAHDATAQAAGK